MAIAHLGPTPRNRRVHGFDDALDVRPEEPPLLLAENHNRNFAAHKILLKAYVLVGCQQ